MSSKLENFGLKQVNLYYKYWCRSAFLQLGYTESHLVAVILLRWLRWCRMDNVI